MPTGGKARGVSFQEQSGVKENFSSMFLIISHLSLLDSRCGPIWHSGHSIYGSGIVSWPSIQPGLHASQSLPSIYSAVAPKKLGMGGSHSSADTFHLCAEGCLFHAIKKKKKTGARQARLSRKTLLWIAVKPLGLYRLFPWEATIILL